MWNNSSLHITLTTLERIFNVVMHCHRIWGRGSKFGVISLLSFTELRAMKAVHSIGIITIEILPKIRWRNALNFNIPFIWIILLNGMLSGIVYVEENMLNFEMHLRSDSIFLKHNDVIRIPAFKWLYAFARHIWVQHENGNDIPFCLQTFSRNSLNHVNKNVVKRLFVYTQTASKCALWSERSRCDDTKNGDFYMFPRYVQVFMSKAQRGRNSRCGHFLSLNAFSSNFTFNSCSSKYHASFSVRVKRFICINVSIWAMFSHYSFVCLSVCWSVFHL